MQENSNDAKKKFLNKHKNIQLEKDFEIAENRIPDLWNKLVKIRDHYKRSLNNYKTALRSIADEIAGEDMNSKNQVIHSVRSRVKDAESLIVKIIQKCANLPQEPQNNSEIEKYRDISEKNYYKIITDLIGIRIIIRYRYQWQAVHSLIWKIFDSTKYSDFVGWEDAYSSDPAAKYIVEKPKAYIKQEPDRSTYEAIGKNIFEIRDSNDHYASIHYIINWSGTLCEIQVRTILDEAWCECNHDFVYKLNSTKPDVKNTLEDLSKILSKQTTAAESTVALMCDLAERADPTKKRSKTVPKGKNGSSAETHSSANKPSETFLSVQKRADKLLNTGGFIDTLFNNN